MLSELGNGREPWGILVVSPDGEQILLYRDGENFSVPRVEIPRYERVAANINRTVGQDLGIPVISLYPIIPAGSGDLAGGRYHAVTAFPKSGDLPHGEWKLISSMSAESFPCRLDFSAIHAFRAGLEPRGAEPETFPFLQPDWFADVARWVADALRSHALRLTGPFQQFNADSLFSLIRFDTNGRAVWLKAVGAGNSREFPLTLALAQLCPARIPKILASKPEWRAWLAVEASGVCLSESSDARQWEYAAAELARLQITSIRAADTLRSAGARDLTCDGLRLLAESFFAFFTSSPRDSLTSDGNTFRGEEIEDIKNAVLDCLANLQAVGLPNTVGHMDLNPANIFFTEAGCVFLDWAEGFLGNPLFSFEYLLQHFRWAVSPGAQEETRFREAYLLPWREVVSPGGFEAAISSAPLAALFAYAATAWSDSTKRALNLAGVNYLASLVRKMRRIAASSRTEGVLL
jgi:Phosphotransferase enzyme family